MKAVVLIGGQGTRLHPLTFTTPKALLPVVNVPFIDRLIRRLEDNGFDEIVFALSYLAGELRAYLAQQRETYRASVICSVEPQPLGSAGALKFNEGLLDETFVLLNGDILTDLDYGEMVKLHKAKGALVTVNIAEVPDPTRFGVIDTNEDDRVVSWQEKPSMEDARSHWANVGIWVIEPSIVSSIPHDRFVSLEREVFQDLVRDEAPFSAFRSYGYWADMGTPESYLQIHRDILAGDVVEPVPGRQIRGTRQWVADNARVGSGAALSGQIVVGEEAWIDRDAAICGASVIGARCRIEQQACITDSILWADSVLGEGSSVKNSIVGRNVRIAPNVCITDSVVADGATIDVPLLRGAKIGPGTGLCEDSFR